MVLENIQNVLNVPEFRKRAVFTLIMFVIFRLGVHIPVPGVDSSVIENLFSSGNLFGLLDLFAGGALSKFSVLAMSITPYINASIIMQLLTAVVPTRFEDGTTVDPVALVEAGILKNVRDGVRILGNGELEKKLTVVANGFTKSAKAKIEAAGGKVVVPGEEPVAEQ